MSQSVREYNKVKHSITKHYRLIKTITEYCRVLHSSTEYYRVLQSITKTNLAHLLGPIFGLVFCKIHCVFHIPLEYRIFKIEWHIILILYFFFINFFCIPSSFGKYDVQNRMMDITPYIFCARGETYPSLEEFLFTSSGNIDIGYQVKRNSEIIVTSNKTLGI